MRLLNAATIELDEFFDSDVPKYAILSHRWEGDEASFQDFERGVQGKRTGFAKIKQCCHAALYGGYEWVWIDTCCIDKKSSAELSEAINSMYNWYKQAQVCYVYLADVIWQQDSSDSNQASEDNFRKSLWFTRGWTLQELLAPRNVNFFDQSWRPIGTKDELAARISGITGIAIIYLQPYTEPKLDEPCTKSLYCRGHHPVFKHAVSFKRDASVATKMSWVSKRQTSRIEDTAYCLLGIFDVNMPLLYGEGRKAFMRLQQEIIKQTDDESIFAWAADKDRSGMLADWPSDFGESRYVHALGPKRVGRGPYTLTNQGLDFPVTFRLWDAEAKVLRVLLDCGSCSPDGFRHVVLSFTPSTSTWHRINCRQLELSAKGTTYRFESSEDNAPGMEFHNKLELSDRHTKWGPSAYGRKQARTPEDVINELRGIVVRN
ncbi:hypothetical protein MMC21_006584 [Puttea exsequens]|nr:hypothetical protein [Puttea exsequens]